MGNCLSIGRGILLCIKLGTAAPPSIPIRHTLVGISLVPPFTFPHFNCKHHHCNDKRGKHLHRNKKPKPVPRGEINVIREDIFQMKGVKQGVHQDKKDKIQQRSPQNVLWLPNAAGQTADQRNDNTTAYQVHVPLHNHISPSLFCAAPMHRAAGV